MIGAVTESLLSDFKLNSLDDDFWYQFSHSLKVKTFRTVLSFLKFHLILKILENKCMRSVDDACASCTVSSVAIYSFQITLKYQDDNGAAKTGVLKNGLITLKNNSIKCKNFATIVSSRKNVARSFVRGKQISTSAEM